MSASGKWISFTGLPIPKGLKTPRWEVHPREPMGAERLGEVRWYGAWRCFAFFPAPETLFERTCLRDIADFCEARTRERRKEKA